MDAQWGGTGIPRYWITLNKEIVWDYPKEFVSRGHLDKEWPYVTDISDISCVIREYLDTLRERLLSEPFVHDKWGIVNILRAADRRIGSRHWDELEQQANSEVVAKIVAQRKACRNS